MTQLTIDVQFTRNRNFMRL